MSIEPTKLPKAPTFLGAILYVMAGIVLLGAGLGLLLIRPPAYYPYAVWEAIGIVYFVLGAIVLGLAYRRFRRFISYLDKIQQIEAENNLIHETETLAEKRP